MDKVVILYTMEGCPYCLMIKDKLNELSIPYIDRDINEHKDEYDVFVEITENIITNEQQFYINHKVFNKKIRGFSNVSNAKTR
jgi:glutaredoxin